MFDYNEFSINESLAPSIEDYNLVKSPRGNYYRHKDYKKYLPKEWIIESDGFVSVDGDVSISNQNFKNIPFLFKKVSGNFGCWNCASVISLEGCPIIVGGYFNCGSCTSLISLQGCPNLVGGDFYCSNCRSLISLQGCPVTVKGNLNCRNCTSLISIDYFKCMINGNIIADDRIKIGLNTIQNLYRQYPLLAKIEDYALFVHTVLEYAPELKQFYKEIPELPENHQDLSTFL